MVRVVRVWRVVRGVRVVTGKSGESGKSVESGKSDECGEVHEPLRLELAFQCCLNLSTVHLLDRRSRYKMSLWLGPLFPNY